MTEYVEVPPARLSAEVFHALLEDYVTRDGTDYGARERSLEEKVDRLKRQVLAGEVRLLYHAASEQWDLVPAERAAQLTGN